jgi:hypothetical protein
MESMKKEEAALKVAAKHHDFLDKATHEYMELTGQVSEEFRQKLDDMCNQCLQGYQRVSKGEITCEYLKANKINCIYPYEIKLDDSFRAAREEMLDILPGYLQPVRNILREYQIFFGKPPIERPKYPIVSPLWTMDKHLASLPESLRDTIQQYAMDAELDQYYFGKAMKENEELRKQLAAAREAYKKINNDDDSHERNARVVQALGLSSGKKGNRQTTDHRQAYMRYVRLVRNEGESREEALKRVHQEFPYNSVNSARKHLRNELKKVKDWWRNRNDLHYALYELHEELEKLNELYQPGKKRAAILENYWKGLIPSENL